MGIRDKLKERAADKAAERDRRAAQAAQEQYDQDLAVWDAERAELVEMIDSARNERGASAAEAGASLTMNLKKGETVFGILDGCALIEPRRERGHFQAGSQGMSFRIAKGVSYRVGGTRGAYVQGEERPTPIDSGVVTITTQRVVFQGPKYSREWAFSKLLGLQHDPTLPWTALHVSNRQKASGFLYDDAHANDVRFRLTLALAVFNETTDDLVAQLESELEQLESSKPALGVPSAVRPEIGPPPGVT